MSKQLLLNPAGAVYFREVEVGITTGCVLRVLNVGTATTTISAVALTTGTKFSVDFAPTNPAISLPLALAPLEEVDLILSFSPIAGDEDTLLTDTLTITSDGAGSPQTIPVAGWARDNSSPRYCVSPSSWNFDWYDAVNDLAGTIIGEWANQLDFTIRNSGSTPLTVNGLAISISGTGSPSMRLVDPTPDFPVILSPGTAAQISLIVSPEIVGTITSTDSIEILTDSVTSPDAFVITLTGIPVTSAFNSVATPPMVTMAALQVIVEKFDITNLDTEEQATFKRIFNFGGPGSEKTLVGVWFKYEDKGIATVNVQAKTIVGSTTTSVNSDVVIGTAGADNWIKRAYVALQLEGELVELQFVKTSGNGQISITEILPVIDDLSQFTELGNLPAVVSAFNATTTLPMLLAFGASVKQIADVTNLDCEEIASFALERNLQIANQEKLLGRYTFKYEDKGSFIFKATAVTKRQTVGPVTTTVTGTNDGKSKSMEFDLRITDEIVSLTFSRAAATGPIVLTEFSPWIEPRGEIKTHD